MRSHRLRLTRHHAILRVRRQLEETSYPRLQMALIVALTGGVGLLASFYVVYLAPGLFAELLFDGALSFTLYRHLRHQAPSHWLGTAVRKTVLPFAITAVFLAAVGAGMAWHAPGARTMGEVIAQHRAR